MRLLANMGSAPEAEPAKACTRFDWREAHYFTPLQLETLKEALSELGPAIARGLTKLCGGKFSVDMREVTQHYTSTLMDQYSRAEVETLFQAFGTAEEESLGVIAITPEHARTWVSFLMGSSEGGEEDTTLSAFELSLLADVTGAVAQAWSQLGDAYAYQPHAEGVCTALHMPWHRAGCVCRIQWVLTRMGEEQTDPRTSEAVFILPGSVLAMLAEKKVRVQRATPEALSQAMTHHLQDIPVPVRIEVGQTKLSFQAMMQLRVHDVVVLDRSVYEPIDVVVAGQRAFCAALGRRQGQQAVRVTARVADSGAGSRSD
jgi:flagellar motor switch protein FliM